MNKKLYRQGDVLLKRIGKIPQGMTKQSAVGQIVLAHGEATGHAHTVDADAVDWWKTDDGQQVIEVKCPASLAHQEHTAILLPPGKYRVLRQVEYTPANVFHSIGD